MAKDRIISQMITRSIEASGTGEQFRLHFYQKVIQGPGNSKGREVAMVLTPEEAAILAQDLFGRIPVLYFEEWVSLHPEEMDKALTKFESFLKIARKAYNAEMKKDYESAT